MNTQKAIAELDAKHAIFVDGQTRGAATTFEVYDPATGLTIAEVADGTVADARAAVDAAHRAFGGWARTSPRHRSDILRRVFDLMVADTERLVALICAENGKSQADARAEVGYAA